MGVIGYFIVELTFISLMINDAIFNGLVIHICSIVNCLFKSDFYWVVFLLLICRNCLYILGCEYFVSSMYHNIFFPYRSEKSSQ